MDTIILVIHLLIIIAMVFVIIVQKSGSDGLGGLGGGSSAGGNGLFTVRGQANLLTKMTGVLATGFIITSLLLATMAARKSDSVLEKLNAETAKTEAAQPAKPIEDIQAGKDATAAKPAEGKSLMQKAAEPKKAIKQKAVPQVPLAK